MQHGCFAKSCNHITVVLHSLTTITRGLGACAIVAIVCGSVAALALLGFFVYLRGQRFV